MEFIGAIIICVFGVEESPVLINQLNEVFMDLIYRMEYDDRARRIMKIIQEYVKCCGADGSDDYINALKPVPYECRDQITGNEYGFGCQQQLAWWLEPWTATLASICLLFMIVHCVQAVLTAKIIRK